MVSLIVSGFFFAPPKVFSAEQAGYSSETWTDGLPKDEIKSLKAFDKQISLNPAKGYESRGFISLLKADSHHDEPAVFSKLASLAISDLTKAIVLRPRQVSARITRASAYQKLRQTEKAYAEYSEIIALGLSSKDYNGQDPNGHAFLSRGMLSLTHRKYFEAAQDFSESIKNDPYNPLAYTSRALAESHYDAITDAINDLSSAIELNPRERQSYEQRADLYEKSGSAPSAQADRKMMAGLEYLQSTEFYKFQVEQNPENAGARFLLADKLMQAGEFSRAANDLSELLKLRPRNVEALYMRGKCWLELKNYALAIADFDRAIQLDPVGARIRHAHSARGADSLYSQRADAFMGLKQYKKAIADYTKILQITPANAGAFSERATAYFMVDDFANALHDDTMAIKLEPLAWRFYRDRAYSYECLGQLGNAINDCNTTIGIIKDDESDRPDKSTSVYLSRIYKLRGTLLARQGKQAASKADIELSTRLGHM